MSGAETAGYGIGYALGGMLANGLLFFTLGAVLVLLVFIVLREFWTWYFKLSEQVRLLKAIEIHLEALEARSRGAAPRPTPSPAAYPATVPQRPRTA